MNYRIEPQADGLWKAVLLDGGDIECVSDCPTEKEAMNAALYALAKNREYREEAPAS